MKKYRTKFDLIADILTLCISSPCEINRLFYSISVSYSRLKELVASIVDSGLLEKNEYGFKTTPKGERFLALYSELYSMVGQQVVRKTIDERLLSLAKEHSYKLKQKDRETGFLLLEGKSKKVIDATSYYIIAQKEGIKVSLAEIARLFHVSPNSVSRMKKILLTIDSYEKVDSSAKSSLNLGKGY